MARPLATLLFCVAIPIMTRVGKGEDHPSPPNEVVLDYGKDGNLQFDLGVIPVGCASSARVLIRNDSSSPVHVSSVRVPRAVPSPGGRERKPAREWIDPGEVVPFDLDFDPRGLRLRLDNNFRVEFDAPKYAHRRVEFRWEIRHDIVVDPASVIFADITTGQSVSHKLNVQYAGREDWKIVSAKCPNEAIEVALSERRRELVPEGHWRIDYVLRASVRRDAPVGRLKVPITVTTNDLKRNTFQVWVSGSIKPE